MDFLDLDIPLSEFQGSRNAFINMREHNEVNESIQFAYAMDLLRSKKQDALKLSDYEEANICCENILKIQPNNHQVIELKGEIKRRAYKDGLTGIATIGGSILGAIALIGLSVGLGVGLSRKK